jgi:hypothetical protein
MNVQQVLAVGSIVRGSGKRVGRVVGIVGKRVLVLWTASLTCGWNKKSLVRLA